MRRAMLFFLIFILVGWVFVPAAHAQFNPMPDAEEFGAIVDQKTKDGQMSKEVYTVNTQASYMNTATCMLIGCSKDSTSAFYYGRSPLALIGGVVTAMYTTPPADIAYWIQDTGQSLGFIPKIANAQGIGFSGFSALLPLWKVFRNIAYFLMAVVMIVIGFMVMFRKKIDPKTVVTVQNALPRIVLTLLLITFSYAIVGLLIDVMYLIMYLAVNMIQSSGLLPNSITNPQALYVNGGLIANMGQATATVNAYRLVGINISAGLGTFLSLTLGGLLATAGILISLPLTAGVGTPTAALVGVVGLVLPVIQFLLAIAMIFLFIRLLIFFVGAYIQIVIAMLFGPVQIMVEAIPGTNAFGSWLKNLIANMAVFPVGIIFFMLSAVFANFASASGAAGVHLWAPSLGTLIPNMTSISSLLSLGILFAIPSVGGTLKETLKAKPFVGAGPEGIVGSFGQPIGLITQGYQLIASHQMMSAIRKGKGGDTKSPP